MFQRCGETCYKTANGSTKQCKKEKKQFLAAWLNFKRFILVAPKCPMVGKKVGVWIEYRSSKSKKTRSDRENERPYLNILQLSPCWMHLETKTSKGWEHSTIITKGIQKIKSYEKRHWLLQITFKKLSRCVESYSQLKYNSYGWNETNIFCQPFVLWFSDVWPILLLS